MKVATIFNYFPELNQQQQNQFKKLKLLYEDWNTKINVVSRKDIDEVQFKLVDAIGKKIKVVNEVMNGLELKNVEAFHARVETIDDTFDFIVSRAVAVMDTFVHWTKHKVKKESIHDRKNGIIYLKGGDLSEELKDFKKSKIINISTYFKEDFFETKKIVYLPI